MNRLSQLRVSLSDVQMKLSADVITARQVRETFPDRTAAMISTIKSVRQWIDRGMSARTVFVAGSAHLSTLEEDLAETEYCLDTLYEELRKHKVAVVIQTG